MKDEIKKFLLNKFGAKQIRKNDWNILYNKLTNVYSTKEIPIVIEKFDTDITLFEPPMTKWRVKEKIGWYINQLILKESIFRMEKNKEYHKEVFDPCEYQPAIKGVQTKKRSTFFDKINSSLEEMEKEVCTLNQYKINTTKEYLQIENIQNS